MGLIGSGFIPSAQADAWDKKTIVTVNEPIIAGNKVLQPGTYVWKLMDSPSNRHVVQIFDKDQQRIETTVLAMPNYKLVPDGRTQFSFWETPSGVPKAVRTWFYPGDNYGQEFAYPKKLVAQLASTAPVPVPMTYNEPAAEPVPVSDPSPAPVPEAAPAPAPEPAPMMQPAPQPQASVSNTVPQLAAPYLPHTASINPLIGLLGVASLSLAGLLSLVGKKS